MGARARVRARTRTRTHTCTRTRRSLLDPASTCLPLLLMFLHVERQDDVLRLAAVLHTLLPLLKSSQGAPLLLLLLMLPLLLLLLLQQPSGAHQRRTCHLPAL